MAGRKVLLIVDVQRGFIKKGMEKIVGNIRRHIGSVNYDLVIQSRWENAMGSQYERVLGYTSVGNSAESSLLIEECQEHVITRCQYSCVTDKFLTLVDKEDTVFVVGVDTDACVLATLYSLWDYGYTFHVYKDSVGTSARIPQSALFTLITRNFGKGCLI